MMMMMMMINVRRLGLGLPGLGKITSFSQTPLGGHYTYLNQGPGYSHK